MPANGIRELENQIIILKPLKKQSTQEMILRDGGNVNNVQYKSNQNYHYESPCLMNISLF
jgi:hypothetical protein